MPTFIPRLGAAECTLPGLAGDWLFEVCRDVYSEARVVPHGHGLTTRQKNRSNTSHATAHSTLSRFLRRWFLLPHRRVSRK